MRALADAEVLPEPAQHHLLGALTLLRNVQALLALVRGGVSEEETFSEADAATLARCAGAVDFAGLDADITTAAERVRSWYRRLIEEPAARAAQRVAEETGESEE